MPHTQADKKTNIETHLSYISENYANFAPLNRVNNRRYGTSTDHLQHFR